MQAIDYQIVTPRKNHLNLKRLTRKDLSLSTLPKGYVSYWLYVFMEAQ